MIKKPIQKCLTQWFLIILAWLLSSQISLADSNDNDSNVIKIKKASYSSSKHRLKVKLKIKGKRPYAVKLIDAKTKQLLLSKNTRDHSVTLILKNIEGTSVPCTVQAQINQLSKTKAVKNAPENCSGISNNSEPTNGNVDTEVKIDDAKYEDNRLRVKGELKGGDPSSVKLFDDITNQELSDRNRSKDSEHFSFRVSNLAQVPCRIRVQAGESSATSQVEHAPDNCSSTQPPPPPVTQNQAPLCSITLPSNNPVNISLGEAVNFAGQASDPEGGALTFEWDFNGGADTRPTVLKPGSILFDVNNGSFLVHFIVTDDHGARCTADKMIVVGSNNTSLPPGMVPQQPAPGTITAGDNQHVVLPANDLGMHCADLGSYPFNILPPFNTINAHVVLKGSTGTNRPLILDASTISLKYSATFNPNDPVGVDSINSTSQNFPVGSQIADASIKKTDFWDEFNNSGKSIAALLFPGLDPVFDEGLLTLDNIAQGHGRYMPGIGSPYFANNPQDFSQYVAKFGWHTAQGIPMTAVDDKGRLNSYPLLRIQAIENSTGVILATTDAVAPVSAEVDCRDCHTAGKVGADTSGRSNGPIFVAPASVDRLDVERAAKRNILSLHDFKHGTDFIAQNQPVLCAGCHKSNALALVGGPAGIANIDSMSNVMHGFHGRLQVTDQGALLRDFQGEPILIDPVNQNSTVALIPFGKNVPMEQNCFQCHPGKITQCFRGAMFTAGQKCDTCHGNLLAVGSEFAQKDGTLREPWVEEPQCESCHTGVGSDAVASLAYDPNDPAAEPLVGKTSRFAVNHQTLYRNSLDEHAKLGCESCHGSPHAIWPNRNPDANDNITAMQLQGHTGTISECTVCHKAGSFPKGTLEGPHGMHPVNDPDWNDEDGHGHFAENSRKGDTCADCHGADHLGTRLAKVPVDRVLKNSKGKVLTTLKAGDEVACNLCHSLNKSFDN